MKRGLLKLWAVLLTVTVTLLVNAVIGIETLGVTDESIDYSNNISIATTDSTVHATGWLDEVGVSTIRGWAWRSDIPDTSINVHIYITNTSTNKQWLIAVMANLYRADLKNAGYGNGYHGFSYSIDWLEYPQGTYMVEVYAIGGNDINPQISNSPQTYTVRSMDGNVEYVNENGIGGWAWKPDSPNTAISVHVYIRRLNGEYVGFYPITAGQPRSDLLSLGYGNGSHGFSMTIDWSALPEEKLRVTVYAVDGSGYHPAFYDDYYENRKQITLLGMVDEDGIKLYSWITNTVKEYGNAIGCSELFAYSGTTSGGVIELIRRSSLCTISTHGSANSIFWSIDMNDSENKRYGNLMADEISALSDGYFEKTRCVVLDACLTGYGGASNDANFVNVLHSKGVWTVIGFTQETQFRYYTDTKTRVLDYGSSLWMKEFMRCLSEGKSVAVAEAEALGIVYTQNGSYCGLNNPYIAGDVNQVVKH